MCDVIGIVNQLASTHSGIHRFRRKGKKTVSFFNLGCCVKEPRCVSPLEYPQVSSLSRAQWIVLRRRFSDFDIGIQGRTIVFDWHGVLSLTANLGIERRRETHLDT